jgi:hypothetical protein
MANARIVSDNLKLKLCGLDAIAAVHQLNNRKEMAERVLNSQFAPNDFSVGNMKIDFAETHLWDFGPFLCFIGDPNKYPEDFNESFNGIWYNERPNGIKLEDWDKITDPADFNVDYAESAYLGVDELPPFFLAWPSGQVMMYNLYNFAVKQKGGEPANINDFTEQLARNSELALKFRTAAKKLKEHLLNMADAAKIDRKPGYAQSQAKWKAQIKAASDEVVRIAALKDEAVQRLNLLIRERDRELTSLDPNYKHRLLSDAEEMAKLGLDQSVLGGNHTAVLAKSSMQESFDDF